MSDKFKKLKKQIRVGVKALVVKDQKLLLVQENIDGELVYDFPGGGIEYGESLEKALKREVKEEVGLEVSVGQVVGAWSFIVKGTLTQAVLIGYQCSLVKNIPTKVDLDHNPASTEHIVKAEWVMIKDLLKEPSKYGLPLGMLEAVQNLDLN